MKYYAGLDVSLEETAICVVDEMGAIVKEIRAPSDPEDLVTALTAIGLSLERVGLEACSLTAWLHDGLRDAGLPAICIETRRANAAMKTMPNKTDRNDARALAQIMRTGWFRQVHVKRRSCRLQRSLLVARGTVLNEMRSIENVVRAILREAGIRLGTPARAKFAATVHELAGENVDIMAMATPLLKVLAVMRDQLAVLTKQVLDTAPRGCRLPPFDECTGCRTDHRTRLSHDHRRSVTLLPLARCRPASRTDAPTLPVRRNRSAGADQPLRRPARTNRTLRGRPLSFDPQPQMVEPQGLGPSDCQTPRHEARPRRCGPQTCRHPASHVARPNHLPLRRRTNRRVETKTKPKDYSTDQEIPPLGGECLVPEGTKDVMIASRPPNQTTTLVKAVMQIATPHPP